MGVRNGHRESDDRRREREGVRILRKDLFFWRGGCDGTSPSSLLLCLLVWVARASRLE